MPPSLPGPQLLHALRFGLQPLTFSRDARRRLGDVWQLRLLGREEPFVITSHPDHVESLFKATPDDAPSLTGESPLRPILGPNSVLTLTGERHMRERKLLLPPFHGAAVQRYIEMIRRVAQREIDRWPVGRPFALAPRMQAVTLDVIMGGIFGIEGTPGNGTPEHQIRETISAILRLSTYPGWQLVELHNLGRAEPRGIMKALLGRADRQLYRAIRARRAAGGCTGRGDVLSLLLEARDEHGQPLSDRHVRDELLSLVLAGHETTANSLAWTVERLLRAPEAYARLKRAVRSGEEEYVEATVHEGMRVRPVIPMVVRLLKRPWRLGDCVVPANTAVGISIVALHHREDIYPDPDEFRPERFLEAKPGTYTWIPFGGGIRRCLGASLAVAEQKIVLAEIARRTDMVAPSRRPERARQRNVTTIPARGGRVVVERRR